MLLGTKKKNLSDLQQSSPMEQSESTWHWWWQAWAAATEVPSVSGGHMSKQKLCLFINIKSFLLLL